MTLTLPAGYEPFESLDLCSNQFQRVPAPIVIGETPLLLVGRGAHAPRIWLAAPLNRTLSEFLYIVEDNVSRLSTVEVEVAHKRKQVHVRLRGIELLLTAVRASPQSARILKLDLKSLGLVISGDQRVLNVGGLEFAANKFVGPDSGILLGQPDQSRGVEGAPLSPPVMP